MSELRTLDNPFQGKAYRSFARNAEMHLDMCCAGNSGGLQNDTSVFGFSKQLAIQECDMPRGNRSDSRQNTFSNLVIIFGEGVVVTQCLEKNFLKVHA